MNVKNTERLYKSERLNYIVNRMRTDQGITPTKLAEELKVSERTIYRDLHNLEKGKALHKRYSRREGRYLLESELDLSPLTLTPTEALALYTAASNPALADDNYLATDLRTGMGKLARALTLESTHPNSSPSDSTHALDATHEIDSTRETLEDGPSATRALPTVTSDSIQRPILDSIRRAMRTNRKLQVRYWMRADDKEQILIVAPYDLRMMEQSWYLLANCEDLGGIRTLKVGRIRQIEILNDRFRYPRRFSADECFARAWELQQGSNEDLLVTVRFVPSVAALVRDCMGHQFVEMVVEADGALVAKAHVNSIKEIHWRILAFGSQAEVLAPPDMRAQFARVTEAMAALYVSPPKPPVTDSSSASHSQTP